MKRILKTFFTPNETDRVLLTLGLGVFLAALYVAGQFQFAEQLRYFEDNEFVLFLSAGVFAGLLCAMGSLVFDTQRTRSFWLLMFLGGLLSIFAYVLTSWHFGTLEQLSSDDLPPTSMLSFETLLQTTSLLTVGAILLPLFALSTVSNMAVQLFVKMTKSASSRFKMNRFKWMCLFAVMMAIAVVARNLFFETSANTTIDGRESGSDLGHSLISWLFPMFWVVANLILLIGSPAWCLGRIRKTWISILFGVTYFSLCIAVVTVGPMTLDEFYYQSDSVTGALMELLSEISWIVYAAYALVFCAVQWVLNFSKIEDQYESLNDGEDARVNRAARRFLPSHWSLALIVVPMGMSVFFGYYDPISLLSDRDKLNWSDARLCRSFVEAQRGDIRISTSPWGTSVDIRFHPNANEDALSSFEQVKVIQRLTVENNCPQIDFAMANIPSRVVIKSGTITSSQIHTLQKLGCDLEILSVDLFDVLKKKGAIRVFTGPYSDGLNVSLFCNENTDSNILEAVGSSQVYAVYVCQNEPNVDFSVLGNVNIVRISGGVVSSKQIVDISNKSRAIHFSGVELTEESSKRILLNGIEFLSFEADDQFTIGDFFNRFTLTNSTLMIGGINTISAQDSDALQEIPSGNKIFLSFRSKGIDFEDWKQIERLVSRSPNSIHLSNLTLRPDFCSRALMVAHSNLLLNHKSCPLVIYSETFFEEYSHLLYQGLQGGDRYKIFLPTLSCAPIREVFNSGVAIHALSLDPEWCDFPIGESEEDEVEILEQVLSDFDLLEELYLSRLHSVDDLIFLSKLKKLKKLQFDLASILRRRNSAIDELTACSSIEELTLLTAPKSSTISQLKKLTNLKRLVIIDSDYLYGSLEKTTKEFRAALPGVAIEIIYPGKLEHLVPQEFREHIERLRAEADSK